MNALDAVRTLTGSWIGTSAVLLPGDAPHTSATALDAIPILADTFVQLAYIWEFDGAPQTGLLIVGGAPAGAEIQAAWMDTWHMGRAIMHCRGGADGDGGVSLRGSYAVEGGPDWGWRIVLTPARDALAVRMYNIAPDGAEELGVEATYARA